MLRRANKGRQESEWTKEEVTAGLLKFQELHGRFPKSKECDTFEFLPSGRSIERSFGGMLALRKELGIEIFFADDLQNLRNIINLKQTGIPYKYASFASTIYFVCANEDLTQDVLDESVKEKDHPLQQNIKLVTLKKLFELVKGYKSLELC